MDEIMSTTKAKDILDDATSVPTTAPDKENEVRDVDENISILSMLKMTR